MPTLIITVTTPDPEFDSGQVVGRVLAHMEDEYGIGGPKYHVEWNTVPS